MCFGKRRGSTDQEAPSVLGRSHHRSRKQLSHAGTQSGIMAGHALNGTKQSTNTEGGNHDAHSLREFLSLLLLILLNSCYCCYYSFFYSVIQLYDVILVQFCFSSLLTSSILGLIFIFILLIICRYYTTL